MYHQPPLYTHGEMVEDWTGCGIGSESAEGVATLSLPELHLSPLPASHPPGPPSLQWEEEEGAPASKRARGAGAAAPPPSTLHLICINPSALPVSVAASLPAAALPQRLPSRAALPQGLLLRAQLPRDATPGLPASLGAQVRYCTLTAEVPPRSAARLCRCAHPAADTLPGLVYLLGAGPPHPQPRAWHGLALGFPLGGAGSSFLCTQGFGGRGHHRGAASHHACDLACAEGTPVLAMADGVVTACKGEAVLGGAHVDLLPECNFVKLRCITSTAIGTVVVSYLHLAPGSLRVAPGAAVKKGDVLGLSGSTGFSLGPHLYVQVNVEVPAAASGSGLAEEGEEGPSVMWAFEATHPHQLPVIPTAGYYYTAQGALAPNAPALAALRQRIGRAPVPPASSSSSSSAGEYDGMHAPPLHTLAQAALLWLHPQAFAPLAEDALPLAAQSQATAERCYPSLHTCLLANVLAPVALLVDGAAGVESGVGSSGGGGGGAAAAAASAPRFTAAFPPLYLSCQLNFERDDATGELFSCEVAQLDQQEGIAEDMAACALVGGVLDPAWQGDWQGFFRAKFALSRVWEVWRGDAFVGNSATEPPQQATRRGAPALAAYAVYTLARCSLAELPMRAGAAAGGGGGGGVVCVFRQGPPDAQPFGMWLCWLVAPAVAAGAGSSSSSSSSGGASDFVLVDLQNGMVSHSVSDAVGALKWEEAPREEVFFAAFARP